MKVLTWILSRSANTSRSISVSHGFKLYLPMSSLDRLGRICFLEFLHVWIRQLGKILDLSGPLSSKVNLRCSISGNFISLLLIYGHLFGLTLFHTCLLGLPPMPFPHFALGLIPLPFPDCLYGLTYFVLRTQS